MFSRRQVVQSIGVAAAGLLSPGGGFLRAQPGRSLGCEQNRIQLIDADFALTNYVEKIKESGVKTVARYYDRDYGGGPGESCYHNPTKRLTAPELKAIEDAGLSVIVIFQHCNANCMNFGADHSGPADKGRKDATGAARQAAELGQPAGTPIYFGIDFDPAHDKDCKLPADGIWPSIETYFGQINEVLAKTPWQVGIYGAGVTCQFVKDRKLAQYFWLSASMAHSGTHTFFNRGEWHIFQNRIDIQKAYGRKGDDLIDTNVVNPTALDGEAPYFGHWTTKGRAAPLDVAACMDILQSRAFLKSGCGYKKGTNDKLRPTGSKSIFNTTCRVMSEEVNGYFGINMTEGDEIEGYAHKSDIIIGLWGNMPKFEAAGICGPAPARA